MSFAVSNHLAGQDFPWRFPGLLTLISFHCKEQTAISSFGTAQFETRPLVSPPACTDDIHKSLTQVLGVFLVLVLVYNLHTMLTESDRLTIEGQLDDHASIVLIHSLNLRPINPWC